MKALFLGINLFYILQLWQTIALRNYIFSQNSSIGAPVTDSVIESVTFDFDITELP